MKDQFEPAMATVKALFCVLDVKYAGELLVSATDAKGAILKHPDAMQQAFLAGQTFTNNQDTRDNNQTNPNNQETRHNQ